MTDEASSSTDEPRATTDDPTLGILVFDGFEELDAIGPYEVFQQAATRGADWNVDLLATEQTDRVTAALGLRVEPDGVLSADTDLDSLLVPGGGWNDRADTGAWAVGNDADTLETIRTRHGRGTTLLSVCTGGMVLERAGLLDGRPAVTHHGAMDDLRESTAEAVDARVVDDGDVLTAGGITSGLDLALWFVEREWGRDVAEAVATEMEYERSRDVYRAE